MFMLRYEVLIAMNMDIMVFQDVMLCNSVVGTNTAQKYAVNALQAETAGTYLYYDDSVMQALV